MIETHVSHDQYQDAFPKVIPTLSGAQGLLRTKCGLRIAPHYLS